MKDASQDISSAERKIQKVKMLLSYSTRISLPPQSTAAWKTSDFVVLWLNWQQVIVSLTALRHKLELEPSLEKNRLSQRCDAELEILFGTCMIIKEGVL